jgi:hypothetical protein
LNEGHQCDVPNCARRREGVSRQCTTHRKRWRRLGHPEARRLYPKDYAQERRDVAALFKANPEHAGLLSALAFLREWLDASARGDTTQPGYTHLARLHRRAVTPMAILSEVSAVWWHVARYQKPDDDRLTFAMVCSMLSLAPRDYVKSYHFASGERRVYRDAGRVDRAAMGEHLRERLAPLFVRVVQACEERERNAREREAAEAAGFAVIPTKRRHRRSKTT